MENFYYKDEFYREIESLLDDLELENEDILELEETWEIECEETTLQKAFVLDLDYIKTLILRGTERWDHRINPDEDFGELGRSIEKAVDLDILNSGVPVYYFPNGNTFKITKQDLINYIK